MIRMVATTRIVLPTTTVRLSAGRTEMSDEGQALCFMSGAGSIFAGDKLLTTPNPDINKDMELFSTLGLVPQKAYKKGNKPAVNENYKNSEASGEKAKWSRPAHAIDANIAATKSAKEKRKIEANS
jgi:biotin synthase